MNSMILLNKFSRGMVWNGIFYTIYKTLFLALSFTLYYKLSTDNFSTWGMINSSIFILLLWLNCGFKKSIPRYCPAFSKDKTVHKLFVKGLILFQSILLTFIGLPLLGWGISKFPHFISFKWYAFGIFVAEGMVTLLRLIYHAHFWQKQFNLLQTCCLLVEMMSNFYFIFYATSEIVLIQFIFITKIISGIFITGISIIILPSLYRDKFYPGSQKINIKKTIIDFVIHSFMMWATSFVKSLSERNILFPYLTLVLGPAIANLFKVAQDGALFFQRIALKTIGVTDTSLLSHIEEENKSTKIFKHAFLDLFKKVFLLCLPLLILTIIVVCYPIYFSLNHEIISLFALFSIGYLLEIVLSPFERVLETKREYKWLWLAYTPYLIYMIMSFTFIAVQRFSLVKFVALLQIFRFSGSFLMTIFSHKKYRLFSIH